MTSTGRSIIAVLAAAGLSACAGTYTGPVEVNRFVTNSQTELGRGTIAVAFRDEVKSDNVRDAFQSAVSGELAKLGYTVVPQSQLHDHFAEIRTSRNDIETAPRGGPVSVGVGGSTGSFGSGVGLGVGINLGGGQRGPAIVTNLSVRISSAAGETLWEGRADLPTSIKSPYSELDLSSQTLADALFQDFPGGNGETVSIDVDDLKETK